VSFVHRDFCQVAIADGARRVTMPLSIIAANGQMGDVTGLADALDPDANRRRAIRGRAKIEQEFDIRDSAAQMAMLFAMKDRSQGR